MSGEGLSQRGAEFQLQPVPASKRKRSTANNDRPRIWPAAPPASRPAPHVPRPVRMRRSQSVPNLKAKYTLDISLEAQHAIVVPARLLHSWNAAKAWSIARQHQHQQHSVMPSSSHASSSTVMMCASSSSSASPWSTSSLSVLPHMAKPATPSHPTSISLNSASATIGAHNTPVFTPSILPPINSQTLKELDLHEILKNPQLRHDLVFDADLQFRPNFDGERGRRKRDLCNKYWRAIQREIQTQCSCTSFYGNLELPCICASHNRRRGSGSLATNNMPGSSSSSSTASQQPHSAEPQLLTRLPSLIAELRCICLSVLPSASGRTFPFEIEAAAPVTPKPPRTASFALRQQGKTSATATAPAMERTKNANDPQEIQTKLTTTSSSSASSAASTPTASSTIVTDPTVVPASASTLASPTSPLSEEHALIMQCLDPALIMQQMHYGVLDIAALITTVGSILKQHCAPMRDSLIDGMTESITQHGDVSRSLRQCFEILELMKLDVANHQLSTSRVYLVETAPAFEARWLRDQVCKGKMGLHRTMGWFSSCLVRHATDDSLSRSAKITKAFDEGFLDLVFDPPVNASPKSVFGALPSPSKVTPPSIFGPQSVSSTAYPETFQFDAFRLLTFHGEVTDITVVSMLLLLFRQLACSPQNLASKPLPHADMPAPLPSFVSALASAQLDNVKSEIWTLLREAEADLTSPNRSTTAVPATPSPPTPGGVASRVLDGRLSSWRKVVGDIVLQIGARAIQVQIDARCQQHGSSDGITPSEGSAATSNLSQFSRAPSQSTIQLLTRWLETNLYSASPLFKLCRSRVRSALAQLTSNARSVATINGRAVSPSAAESCSPMRAGRKRAGSNLSGSSSTNCSSSVCSSHGSKRHKLMMGNAGATVSVCGHSTPSTSSTLSPESGSPASGAGSLESFAAEIGLLAERMKKVKAFHLTVYRVHYERIGSGHDSTHQQQQQQQSSTLQKH